MKQRAGQAGLIFAEAVHQLGRILMLLFMLALALVLLFAFRLSFGPLELPDLASRLATAASGDGISIHMDKAELAWAGYRQGGGTPLVLRLGNIAIRNGAGALLAQIPEADASVPPADIFGAREKVTLRATNLRFTLADAPVTGQAEIVPGPGFSLAQGVLGISIGAGRLGQGAGSVALQSADFTIQARPGAVDIADGRIALAPRGDSSPHLRFTFIARRAAAWAGTLTCSLDAVRAQDLAQYWPPPLLHLTRQWVVTNITAGIARDAAFTFTLAAPADLSRLALTGASGQFSASAVTLHWLPGAAPITQLTGQFTMPDADNIVITASSAQLHNVALSQGVMRITGVAHKDQLGLLTLALNGALPDVLAQLDAPPLNLLHAAPPGVRAATGTAVAQLALQIPFRLKTSLADINLGVTAQLHDVAMRLTPALGFSQSEVALQSDGRHLQLSADARFAGAPAHLTLDEGFGPNGLILLNMDGQAGPPVWQALGLDDSAMPAPAGQAAPFTLHVSGQALGSQNALLRADLTPVSLALPGFGWRKAAGTPGTLSMDLALLNGTPAGVKDFAAQAPDLKISGTSQGNVLRFTALDIGRTQASGTLASPARPGQPWLAQFSGPMLDMRQDKQNSAPPSARQRAADAAPPSGPAWVARLQFATLYLAPPPAPPLTGFSFIGTGRGGTLLHAQAHAQGLDVSVTPLSATRRTLMLQTDDAGLLLRASGEYASLRGGVLHLTSQYGGAAPAAGSVNLQNARIVNAPDVTKLLQSLTLYGVAAAASGPGLLLNHADIPFTLDYGLLQLKAARAFSPSLGFTASGSINLGDDVCDLDTTIVPAYALNTLPGKLPLLGRIFSAEKGGGLIAMRAHLSGKIGDADVSINPLSALTPGFLRGIFGLGSTPTNAR